jgi:hypothetical protein
LTEKSVTFKGNKMNWIRQKLELQIIIIKPNLIIQDPKRIGLVALQRIANPIILGKFEIGMRSRSDSQNNVIFRNAPIHDPIRQKPWCACQDCRVNKNHKHVFIHSFLNDYSCLRNSCCMGSIHFGDMYVLLPRSFLSG